ncbi:hypothetical protein GCM10027586_06200 [Kineococcus gypseus]|uniref:hypothetical protein n=1 Tax=Kineococcus gypseus TaxID=1637102 RepID=UPI003D7C77BB
MSAPRSSAEIVALWQLVKEHKQLNDQLLAEWRCGAHRCLLAQVFEAQGQRLMVFTGYTLSPVINESTSSDSARAKNTRDGDKKWRSRGLVLDEEVAFATGLQNVGYAVNCRHILQKVLTITEIRRALTGTLPGKARRLAL